MISIAHIYAIQNTINKKEYIGATEQYGKRIRTHFAMLRRNAHPNEFLQKDFNQYGEDNFKSLILYEVSKKDLNQKEIQTIQDRKTLYNQNGYNITIGGSGVISEYTSKKQAQSNIDNAENIYKIDQEGNLIEIYHSIAHAAKENNVAGSNVWHATKTRARVHGYYYYKESDYKAGKWKPVATRQSIPYCLVDNNNIIKKFYNTKFSCAEDIDIDKRKLPQKPLEIKKIKGKNVVCLTKELYYELTLETCIDYLR